MRFALKTISGLIEDLKKNPYQWKKLDELYWLFLEEKNISGAVVVREGRYKNLVSRYSFLEELPFEEEYTAKSFFESPERIHYEMIISKIDLVKKLNPDKRIVEIVDIVNKYFNLIEGFAYDMNALEQEIKKDIIGSESYKTIRRHYNSALNFLTGMDTLVDYLDTRWFDKHYQKQINRFVNFLKMAKTSNIYLVFLLKALDSKITSRVSLLLADNKVLRNFISDNKKEDDL